MQRILDVEITGQPVQWARARVGQRENELGKWDKTFHTAPEQSRYKGIVRDIVALSYRSGKARREHDGEPLGLGVPCVFECKVFLSIPASFTRRDELAARTGAMRPTGKPDLDNWIKLPMDAIEGIIYRNDSQVIGFGDSGIWYAPRPRLELKVWRVDPDDVLSEVEQLRAAVLTLQDATALLYSSTRPIEGSEDECRHKYLGARKVAAAALAWRP